ncbi:MAG TPA: CDP-alcohol phosphatidyltransferase family protein [Candidatus Limnocylindrales bacterium]
MTQSFVSPALRQRVRGWATPIALGLGRVGLTPNSLTVIGFAGTCVAAWAAATQQWLLAGVLVLAFGIFDLFDGALARATGKASRFGAFLDSTLDRTGEGLVYAGIVVGAAWVHAYPAAWFAAFALALASVVTYSRAKAEALGLDGEVGVAPRPERLVLLAGGLIAAAFLGGVQPLEMFGRNEGLGTRADSTGTLVLALALGLIALLSAITIVQRIVHVKRQLDAKEQEKSS